MGNKFSIEAIFTAIDRISEPVSKMEKRLLSLSSSTGAALRAVDGINSQISAGIQKTVAGLAVAGTAIGAVAMNIGQAGMGFEQQMADLGAVSLKSRDQIADLEAKARQLGATTKFTATEVGAGMELMAKAGFENQDILQGIGGMLAAAAAEGGDFATTAGHISNVLKGMGIETSRAGEVADVLALASVRTNSSISSLGESMSNVSATAREFKIPLKDVVAGVALLQDVGLDASVAGSAMNTMLINLAKPTDAMRAKMSALGIKFEDAHHNMLPLPKVLEQFSKAADKSGGNMKTAAFFADLVGLRGQKAASNLATMFKNGKFQQLADELEHAAGSAEKMAALRMDTLGGDLETLGGSVDELKIRLFDLNSGPLREVVQGMNKWVDANKDLIVSKVQDFITGLVENLPEIVKWVKRIGVGIGIFYGFAFAVKAAKLMLEGYETAVKLGALALKGWRGGMVLARWLIGKVTEEAVASGAQLELFGDAATGAGGKLSGLRASLNESGLGKAINGVTSTLGKAGLLGAAALVGYEFGSWLNDTFKLDEKINDLITSVFGLNDALGKLGGKRGKQGLGQGENQELADGTVVGPKGELVKLGTGAAGERHILSEQKKSFLREEEGFKGMRMNAAMRRDFERAQALHHAAPATAEPQVVTPQERTTKAITESNETSTEKVELTIKGDTDRAEVTKKPKRGRVTMRLQPSGAM